MLTICKNFGNNFKKTCLERVQTFLSQSCPKKLLLVTNFAEKSATIRFFNGRILLLIYQNKFVHECFYEKCVCTKNRGHLCVCVFY